MEEDELGDKPQDEVPWWKGPLKYVLGGFMIFIILLWLIPVYSIKLDPSPAVIPKLSEVVPSDIEVSETHFNQISIVMVDGSDPVIKEVADKIAVRSCIGKGQVCYAKALFYFVRDSFEYVSDPTEYEYVKTARQSLVSEGGDCDDSSVLLASLLDAIGIPTRFVFIPGHVYVQAYIPDALNKYKEDDWVNMDPACSFCDFGEISWKSFNQEERILE